MKDAFSMKQDKDQKLGSVIVLIGGLLFFLTAWLMDYNWYLVVLVLVLAIVSIIVGAKTLEKSKTYKKTNQFKMFNTIEQKNDPKLTKNLKISLGAVFAVFAGLLAIMVILENQGSFKQLEPILTPIFMLTFPSFFFVLAYFGIKKKYFIPADVLSYQFGE